MDIAQRPMHLDGKPDDSLGQFARKQRLRHGSVPLRGHRVKRLTIGKG
jgi:hypothetical protein